MFLTNWKPQQHVRLTTDNATLNLFQAFSERRLREVSFSLQVQLCIFLEIIKVYFVQGVLRSIVL